MKGIGFLLLFLACWSNIRLIRAQLPKVCLDGAGTACVIGRLLSGYQTYRFEAFLGIPYAKPPIGDLRFSNPVEAPLWKGTISAQYPKPDCIQKNYINALAPITGSEDCLYLNVYRPLNRPAKKLPVLFYIHGGGFFSGSASPYSEGPEYFMDTNDVILVVPAYRLGPFGFLSTNDAEITGNFGLKDQNLALKWVKEYISAFGGDPDRVTLFGHNAGAAAVHIHATSSLSKELFNNAILLSGAANAPYAKPVADPKSQVVALAEAAGVGNAKYLTTEGLAIALRKINPITLLVAADKLKSWNVYPLPTFHPNIEKAEWPGAFLTEDPSALPIEKPWIISNVPSKGEGVSLALHLASNQILRAQFNKDFDNVLNTILAFPDNVDKAAKDAVISKYLAGATELSDDTLDGFLELLGDAFFIYPAYKTIDAFLSNAADTSNLKGIVKFNYRGPYSYSTKYTNSFTNFSTVHGDDALFLFRAPQAFPWGYLVTSPEAALVRRYVELYVEFAKTGEIKDLVEIETYTKDLFDTGKSKYLSIVKDAEPFRTESTWDIERLKLWDNIYVQKD